MERKIIKIDVERCNGCGLCAAACHEGAIGMVDGRARLLREDYCDGLGDCLPACPVGAISFEVREAPAYDAEAARAALPSPQRHIHTIDFKSSKSTLCMFGLSLAVVCCGVHIHRLHDRIGNMCDAELKYRYIRMKGEASSERIAELEDIFEWNRDDDKIRQMKKNVEQYERTIQQRIALDEQIRLKGQETEQLDEKAKKLRGK